MDKSSKPMTLDPEDLNPTDRAILAQLHSHPMTPAYIALKTNYSKGNIRNRLTYLASHDHVEAMGGGMWQLTDDPRDD